MAGTAKRVPETSPLISAWRTSSMRSGDLQQGELAALDLLVAELAGEDVALLVEVARAGGAAVVDLLAGGDRLDAVDGVVDRLAATLADLADIILDGDASGVLGLSHRHQRQAAMVVDLAGVRIGCGEPRHLLHLLIGVAALGRRRRERVDALDHFRLADLVDQLLVQRIGEARDLALV